MWSGDIRMFESFGTSFPTPVSSSSGFFEMRGYWGAGGQAWRGEAQAAGGSVDDGVEEAGVAQVADAARGAQLVEEVAVGGE
jgi:hypothetical protein